MFKNGYINKFGGTVTKIVPQGGGGKTQKHVILEGFKQNGHYHRNQRIFLRIKSCVKIDFRHFLNKYDF